MIIPVRCFTCGKVRRTCGGGAFKTERRRSLPAADTLRCSYAHVQVIGNKWDTYLDLLQADYSEG
jgi:DNA-directed RNA polymerase subunit N (RpoN/RPB10)